MEATGGGVEGGKRLSRIVKRSEVGRQGKKSQKFTCEANLRHEVPSKKRRVTNRHQKKGELGLHAGPEPTGLHSKVHE